MISGKFAVTLHILTLLAKSPEEFLSSDCIAGSLNMNAVLVRKEIANLKKHGLVESREGKNGGMRLVKPAEQITLDAIYKLTFESVHFGFSKKTPNPDCPVGKQINTNLGSLYADINRKISKDLGDISLQNFCETF